MWESISSGAVSFSIKDWRQIGKEGEESEDKLVKTFLGSAALFSLSLFFLGSDEVWI